MLYGISDKEYQKWKGKENQNEQCLTISKLKEAAKKIENSRKSICEKGIYFYCSNRELKFILIEEIKLRFETLRKGIDSLISKIKMEKK